MPPAPTPSSSEAQAPVRNLFPFVHKPNTLERDRIVFPAGWDSWGRISVTRDGFDAKMCWERDLESGEQETSEAGVKEAYATLVHDQGSRVNCFNLTFFTIQFTLSQPPPLPPFNNPVPEQAYLAKNLTNIRDPRGAFRNLLTFFFASMVAGIVGPLGSSSFNLHNVERALNEWKAESDLQIHLLSKLLLEDLEEAKQAQLDCPHWAPRLHPPVLVVCVHLVTVS